MNKNFKLSLIAATMVSTLFVGCSSDSSSISSSSLSGNLQKNDVSGATVTLGDVTATTDANGDYSMSVPSTETATALTATGGTYTVGGVDKNNTVTFKSTKAQAAAGVKTTMLTTLMQNFQDANSSLDAAAAQALACNALGIDNQADNLDLIEIPEENAVAVALMLEKFEDAGATSLEAAMDSLIATSATKVADVATIVTNLRTAAATSVDINITDVNSSMTVIADGKSLGFALEVASGDANASDYNASAYALSNVMNLDGNTTDNTTAGAAITLTLNTTDSYVKRSNDAISATNYVDNNQTSVKFKLEDSTSGYTSAGTGALYIDVHGIDEANANSSYEMRLSGLDSNASGSFVILNDNSSAKVYLNARSSTGKSAMNSNTSASAAILAADVVSDASDFIVVNISKFINYMKNEFDSISSSADGNFTSGFVAGSGNYSARVFVNVDDRNMTRDERIFDIVKSDVKIGADLDGTSDTTYKAYKILDANLTY